MPALSSWAAAPIAYVIGVLKLRFGPHRDTVLANFPGVRFKSRWCNDMVKVADLAPAADVLLPWLLYVCSF